MKARVNLADDHALLHAGLESLLQAADEFDVVGETENGRDTVALTCTLEPDVVVMDVAMPGMNGVDATRRITRLLAEVRVLALSSHADGSYVKAMREAGAHGYRVKAAAVEELEAALDTVLHGRVYVSPRIRDGGGGDCLQHDDRRATQALSSREREVLQLVAEGKSSVEIAALLHLSGRTVETHRRRIMDKLAIRSVAGLTRYAIREGITSLGT